MKAYTQSTGARALAAIAKKSGGFPTVAARLGCAAAAPRHWSSGLRTPSPAWRTALFGAYGIEPTAWDELATSAAPPSSSTKATRPPAKAPRAAPAPPDADEHPEATIDTVIASLSAIQAEIDNDPVTLASFRDRTNLLQALNTAIATRARLRGEDQVSKRRFMGSSWWTEIKAALGRGLRGHPAAAAAVARELDALEDAADVGAKGGQHV